MRNKLFSPLPAIVAFLAISSGGSANAQYSWDNLYPSNTSTIYTNSQVTCTGVITVAQGATAPNAIKVTIKDNRGNSWFGTGGVMNQQGTNKYNFGVAVTIPSNAATGAGTCTFQPSTNGGATWLNGTQTTPTISSQ